MRHIIPAEFQGSASDAAPFPALMARAVSSVLRRVRERRPKVHCLTSPVALELSANVLLAVGAAPSLSDHPATVTDFVAATDALSINLGMLEPVREQASMAAAEAARTLDRPWLLDPVKVEASPARLAAARRLLQLGPAVVRGNAAEIAALAAPADAAALAARTPTVVACTGAIDRLTDGVDHIEIGNGNPLMDRVTAVGCAASALVAAFLALEPRQPLRAAASALLVIGVAGELAAARARGPGSFAAELLDALYRLDEADLIARARLR
jgi:hydroxyethylthiazole kinase